jgi:PadR family transcriptional regulator PadR
MATRFSNNWNTQLRKGVLEFCILNAISGTRLYGYDIVKRLRPIEGLVISEGTIYPILSRLRKEGFLETTLQESPEGPARKYYQVTAQGRRQLETMNAVWDSLAQGIDRLRKEQAP